MFNNVLHKVDQLRACQSIGLSIKWSVLHRPSIGSHDVSEPPAPRTPVRLIVSGIPTSIVMRYACAADNALSFFLLNLTRFFAFFCLICFRYNCCELKRFLDRFRLK